MVVGPFDSRACSVGALGATTQSGAGYRIGIGGSRVAGSGAAGSGSVLSAVRRGGVRTVRTRSVRRARPGLEPRAERGQKQQTANPRRPAR